MNIGLEIISHVLRTGDLRSFLDAGLTRDWLNDKEDPTSRQILDPPYDYGVYFHLIRHYETHRRVMSEDIFRETYPELRLSSHEYLASEIIEQAQKRIRESHAMSAAIDIASLTREGRHDDVLALIDATSRRLRNFAGQPASEVDVWDAEIDVQARLNRVVPPGIKTGIPGLDSQFSGFQKGDLITYLGRAKAGKTSFLLLSALKSWEDGYKVMFVTVEIGRDDVHDKLDAFKMGLPFTAIQSGTLSSAGQKRYTEVREDMAFQDDAFYIIQPRAKYTINDLRDDIEKYNPEVLYIDGFYFLTDRISGKTGGNWEGHDNLSRELKELAMELNIPLITTMQVREKQLKAKGIDDGAMMGGTGLTMASTIVLGLTWERETRVHDITCTRSRTLYLEDVSGLWDWDSSKFVEVVRDDDQPAIKSGFRASPGRPPF